MPHQINPEESSILIGLFKDFSFTIAVQALLKGYKPGKIYVDRLDSPCLAVLWDMADGVYISCLKPDQIRIQLIQSIIRDFILPQARKSMNEILLVIYCIPKLLYSSLADFFDESWSKDIVIANFYELVRNENTRLIQSKKEFTPPDDYQLVPIDGYLLSSERLSHVDTVKEEILSNWHSLNTFFANAFGFCIIDESRKQILSWTLADNLVQDKVELSVETAEPFQNRGLATHNIQAMIKESTDRGLSLHWYCFKDNIPSVNLAEKMGFQLIQSFSVLSVKENEN